MSESAPQPPESEFTQDLDELLTLATYRDNTNGLWFRFPEGPSSRPEVFERTEEIQDIETHQRPDTRQKYWYRIWSMANREPREVGITTPPSATRDLTAQDAVVLTAPNICARFATRANTPDEFYEATMRLAEWGATHQNINRSTAFLWLQNLAVVMSHGFTWSRADSSVATEGLPQLFAAARDAHEDPRQLRRGISKVLGNMLSHKDWQGWQAPRSEVVEEADLLQAITAYDQLDLLEPSFWVEYGVDSGGAIKTPGFLPMLREKISTDPRAESYLQVLPRKQEQALAVVRHYATMLLEAYGSEPDRNQRNAGFVLEHTKSVVRQKRADVELQGLVVLANAFAKSHNDRLESEGKTEGQLPLLDRFAWPSPIDALDRLLTITRNPSAPPEVKARQFEQDVQHVEVLATLMQHIRFYSR